MFQYTKDEVGLFRKLNTPSKIQDFLNTLPFNFEEDGETCVSPRRVLREKTAHCMEGAMFAGAVLEYHGEKPLLLDLRVKDRKDYDHVVAVFRQDGFFGAISKTNHAVLRFREPVYKTLRELVMSYFHEYFLDSGQKTLREYSDPFDLSRLKIDWRTSEENLFEIPKLLDKSRHHKILSQKQIRGLRKSDPIEISAGKITQYSPKPKS